MARARVTVTVLRQLTLRPGHQRRPPAEARPGLKDQETKSLARPEDSDEAHLSLRPGGCNPARGGCRSGRAGAPWPGPILARSLRALRLGGSVRETAWASLRPMRALLSQVQVGGGGVHLNAASMRS